MLNYIKIRLRNIRQRRRRRAQLAMIPPTERELIGSILDLNLTYLPIRRLQSIYGTCKSIEEAKLPGIFIEAGCALGGSSVLISKAKSRERCFCIYDVFGMIPPPAKGDPKEVHDRYRQILAGKSKGLAGDKYYGYEENLYEIVKNNLISFGIQIEQNAVQMHKGLLQDTMKIDTPVAFAHIDVDWFDPVKVSLERIFPRLVSGGTIIFDDYYDWESCRRAVDEYLVHHEGKYSIDDSAGHLKITRI